MAEVCWSVKAAADLEAIEHYIARDSPQYAVQFVNRLVRAAERLEARPQLGRIVPEYQRRDLRELIFGSYRIVYVVEQDRTTIARVVHGSRDLIRAVGTRPWVLR